jgi:hypothetical protein
MLAIAAQRDAAEQFGLTGGIAERPLDANRNARKFRGSSISIRWPEAMMRIITDRSS